MHVVAVVSATDFRSFSEDKRLTLKNVAKLYVSPRDYFFGIRYMGYSFSEVNVQTA